MRIIDGDGHSARDHSAADQSKSGVPNTSKAQMNGHRGQNGDPLLARYRRTRSRKLRDQLIESYREVVERMAQALSGRLPPCVDVQDLVHAGVWGLLQAIDCKY